jgi:hypothetical protein
MANGDFGNTIYDGSFGFGIKIKAPKIVKKVVKVVKKAAPKPVKTAVKTTAKVAVGSTKIVKPAAQLAVKTAIAPTKIAVATVTKGPGGGLKAAKGEMKSELSSVRDVRSATGKAAAPITKPALKIAGDTWDSKVGKLARKVVFNKFTDPGYIIKQQHKLFNKIPIVGPAYNTIDRYSGGTLTQVEVASQVSGKLGRGEPVTKAELLTAAVVAIKAGAIAGAAFTGGASMALIAGASTMAGSMKQGPLGNTAVGRTLLTVGEVAGTAYIAFSTGGAATAAEKSAEEAGKQAATQVAQKAVEETAKQAAEKTVQQAITEAIKRKAQEMAAEKVGREVAKKTGGGAITQIATSAALGPGTLKEAAVAASKKEAAKEAGKKAGPAGALIAQAAIVATSKADFASGKMTKSEAFSKALQDEVQIQAREIAKKKAEDEFKKAAGPTASLLIAGAKGESISDIAKTQLTLEAQKQVASQLKVNTSQIEALNLQKVSLAGQIQNLPPDKREIAFNNLVNVDTQIVKLQAERNINLQKLGYSPTKEQAMLTQNSKTGQVQISKVPDFSLSQAEREKRAELTTEVEANKLEELNTKFYDKAISVNSKVGKLKEMADVATTLKQQNKMKEAETVEIQMAALDTDIQKEENEALILRQEIEAQKIQGVLKVTAAKEGRYDPGSEFDHPLLAYGYKG